MAPLMRDNDDEEIRKTDGREYKRHAIVLHARRWEIGNRWILERNEIAIGSGICMFFLGRKKGEKVEGGKSDWSSRRFAVEISIFTNGM